LESAAVDGRHCGNWAGRGVEFPRLTFSGRMKIPRNRFAAIGSAYDLPRKRQLSIPRKRGWRRSKVQAEDRQHG
jgi:hypothetical protein